MCVKCKKQTSITAGTLFHRTHKPLRIWFLAMWFVTSQKYGTSALGLQRALGLGSYNTAWNWLHKLRRAMVRPGRDRLTGTVEVDETYVGGGGTGVRGRRGSHFADPRRRSENRPGHRRMVARSGRAARREGSHHVYLVRWNGSAHAQGGNSRPQREAGRWLLHYKGTQARMHFYLAHHRQGGQPLAGYELYHSTLQASIRPRNSPRTCCAKPAFAALEKPAVAPSSATPTMDTGSTDVAKQN